MANPYGLPDNNILTSFLMTGDATDRGNAVRTQNMAGQIGILGALQQQALRRKQEEEAAQLDTLLKQSGGNLDALIPALSQSRAGLGMLPHILQAQKAKDDMAEGQRQRQFFSPENVARFSTPGRPAYELPPEVEGPTQAAEPAKMDVNRFATEGAMLGIKGMEPLMNHLNQQMSRQDALTARLYDMQIRSNDKDLDRASKESLARMQDETRRQIAAGNQAIASMAAAMRGDHAPIMQTDDQGNTRMYDRQGNLIRDLGNVGKKSGAVVKLDNAKKQQVVEISRAITELEKATANGGLIDKSTGSGIGSLVDTAAGFVGSATPGAIAVGQLKPIYDLVLKMVPRFEGPQSDRDTKLYQDAAGQLANPAVPNAQKKAAGKEILRLMKQRKAQFINKDIQSIESETSGGSSGGTWQDLK